MGLAGGGIDGISEKFVCNAAMKLYGRRQEPPLLLRKLGAFLLIWKVQYHRYRTYLMVGHPSCTGLGGRRRRRSANGGWWLAGRHHHNQRRVDGRVWLGEYVQLVTYRIYLT